jgi:hypothetical protein
MTTDETFELGTTVELRDAVFDTVGTVVALLRSGDVKGEWNTGPGLMGKTTLLSVRALRRREEPLTGDVSRRPARK